MAEELGSKLGFDVSQAVTALNLLKRQLDSYSTSLAESAGGATKFNASQSKVDKALISGAATAERAAKELKEFGVAEGSLGKQSDNLSQKLDRLIDRFTKLSVISRQGATSVGKAGLPGAGPLTGALDARQTKINADAELLQTKQLQAGSAAIAERIRFAQQLANVEKQARVERFKQADTRVRDAFRPPPAPPLGPTADSFDKDGERIGSRIQRLSISWAGLVKIFATQLVFNGLSQITSQLTQAIGAAIKFETQLAQIQTISQEFKGRGLDATAEAVRNLSDQFGLPIEDVAAGLYETLSNQVGNAAESTFFLGEALQFSRASVTSAADSVDLLSGVINSYGLTAASAGNISDQLFVTIDKGRVKGEDLANTIGRILPLSSALGIELSEVNTAMAELTIQGVSSSDAMTQLTNVMLKLVKPTEALQGVFDKLGISSAEAGIAAFGFDGFLRKIIETGGSTTTEIGKLFNQIRGTRGVIGIVTRDSAAYAETLRQIEDASKNAAAAVAAQTVLETPAQQLTIELTKLRNFLVNDFGRSAVETFAFLTQNVISAKNAFVLLTAAGSALAIALGTAGLLALANQAVSGLKALGLQASLTAGQVNFLTASISRLALLAGTAITIVIAVQLIKHFSDISGILDEAAEAQKNFEKQTTDAAKEEIKAIQSTVDARKKAINAAFSESGKLFAGLRQNYLKDKEAAFSAQRDITAQLGDQLKERQGLIQKALSTFKQIQTDASKNIEQVGENQTLRDFDINRNRFERDLKAAEGNPNLLADALLARSNKVLDAARKAFQEGNTEFGQQLLDESFDLANRVADTQGQRARGEGQINRLLQEQKSINDELIRQEQSKAAQAKAAEDATRKTLLKTSSQIDEIQSINEQLLKDRPDDPTELLARRQELIASVETQLKALSPGNLSALRDLRGVFDDLKAGFQDPITGTINSLQNAFANASTNLVATMNRSFAAAPIDVKIRFTALTGEQLSSATVGQAGDAEAALRKQLLAENENTKAIALTRKEVTDSATAFDRYISTLIRGAGEITGFGTQLDTIKSHSDPARESFQRFIATVRELETKGLKAAAVGDIKAVEEVAKQFEALQATAQAATGAKGFFGDAGAAKVFAETTRTAAEQIRLLAEAQAKLKNEQVQASGLEKIVGALQAGDQAQLLFLRKQDEIRTKNEEVLRELGRLPEVVGASVTDANTKLSQYSEQTIRDERQRTIDLLSQPLPTPAAPTATTQANAKGGLIHYFANGGFVPRGTDTVPAMLSPGEIVMNAGASRTFYSELMAMNRQVNPVYRAAGGPVSNVTTVGDININIPSQRSGRVNGRELAGQLRRELRRGTIRRF